MNAEIISVGTELTLGEITNTNARFLANQLRELDINCFWQTTIDDQQSRIVTAINQAKQRADLIFICGGLGPTADDVTMESVAKAVGTKLGLDKKYWQTVQADFKHRGIDFTHDNVRQAYYLDGGQELANPVGLALGSMIERSGHTYVVLPGPPREFQAMVKQSLMPQLKRLSNGRTIMNRLLHFVGYPESTLMDDIHKILEHDTAVIATSYVQPDETQVRLTVFDHSIKESQQLLDYAETQIIEQLSDYYFGTGEGVTLAGQVVKHLKKKGLTLTAAESLTAGLFQSTICSVPGASQVFDGGFVTYATEMKTKLLSIPEQVIQQNSVVSGAVAGAMAQHSRQLTGADLGIGLTGVAGPDELEGHPVGEVWLGIDDGHQIITKQLHLSQQMGRQAIRHQSVQLGLLAIEHLLRTNN
ncbi:competence/damage-inducible protein A [uncultured Limosilactobacillus sp.]|uniref:competence/damage-inducible protein A n=1 Tax=uncultured Limosilactobacillus sp. TaxID=2837629 RepID=UPI0025EA99CF|nr:competence/damage-inducible protein A [uncultured Limosilactobacillus sp.]